MNYELYMGEALAEGRLALDEGERPGAAVAVLDEAMVGRAHDQVRTLGDPTAHAVLLALREAARKLGPERLGELTIFTTLEPCPMCAGALVACEVAEVVFAVPASDGASGAAVLGAVPAGRGPRVVSGIRRDEVEELLVAVRP